ncbi:hypothetical protein Micbo1qcDRAFT_236887 [Microdochium bolleyi]|uniref:C2H2-type domain-containing protein n=1 Tax=Microdochium bolleyi TaxID=196109 RepID=A0A136INV5_9PEZI|nr:hypothetical protein Micbo1qcDRAFT_236887 [Microdochium bolleyi]
MAPLQLGTISDRVALVRRLFSGALTEREHSPGTSHGKIASGDVTDSLDRFVLWAGQLGAQHPAAAHLSLDYRLRDVPEISERICEILDELSQAVSSLSESMITLAPGDPSRGQVDYLNEAISETDTEASDSGDLSDDARSILQLISEYLRSLFKIAVLIRNSGPRDRFKQAMRNSDATFTDVLDVSHLRQKFPKLSPSLQKALGLANVKRRQFIIYCRDHQARLSHDACVMQEHGTLESVSQTAKTEVLSSSATTFLPTPSLDAWNNDKELDADDLSSLGSVSTVTEGTTVLTVPPLSALSPDGEPFSCPICCIFQSCRSQRAWQKHVFSDLKAYVCTTPDCAEIFGDRRRWFEHELTEHRAYYTCILCVTSERQYSADSGFRVEHAHRFMVGSVFKAMWVQPRGARANLTDDAPYYEGIRRFIVVSSRAGYSNCVAIFTYGRQGCAKHGVHPEDHGQVYDDRYQIPDLRPHEPRLGFEPLPVTILPQVADLETLDESSRVHYVKLYTVEHNIPVQFIGTINPDFLDYLISSVQQQFFSQPSIGGKERRAGKGKGKGKAKG